VQWGSLGLEPAELRLAVLPRWVDPNVHIRISIASSLPEHNLALSDDRS
jgi:hypothetical protein